MRLKLVKGAYSGHLDVERGGSAFAFPIGYDDLVPMSLFVDSGGTSLYTAWASTRLPEKFQRDAGFAADPVRGHVALEFKFTRFDDVLRYIDFCKWCLGDERNDLVKTINLAFAGGSVEELQDQINEQGSYINSDVGTAYELFTNNRTASVSGEIIRYYWKGLENREETLITAATAFVAPEAFLAKLNKSFEDKRKEIQELRADLDKLKKELGVTGDEDSRWEIQLAIGYRQLYLESAEETVKPGLKGTVALHRDAFLLYETLALLRSFKVEAPKDDWANFMKDVRSLADTRPQPWIAYTKAFC